MNIHFTDFFNISQEIIDKYGAFNISLINDLPLFVDPFLLFNSIKPDYQVLHQEIINYLKFLKNKSIEESINEGLINRWFRFKEVKQNWLGYSLSGNSGRGLGKEFANTLYRNFKTILKTFGNETITKSSHLEKLTLIKDGIGKDAISDFTVNLIKQFLLKYTQDIAVKYIEKKYLKEMIIDKVYFNYETESWVAKPFILPWYYNDYVLLTPKDILSKDENWINKNDLYDNFENIVAAIDNDQLRAQVNNYFTKLLYPKIKKKEYENAINQTIQVYPLLVDYYINDKEMHGEEAKNICDEKLIFSINTFVNIPREITSKLSEFCDFYNIPQSTLEETYKKIIYFKQFIEDNDGYRFFYEKGKPIKREIDFQLLFRLVWYATPSDFNSEVNNGRGPVDFKISRGSKDKTLVEFKLASNPSLSNFISQVEKYENANNTKQSYKVILFFSDSELDKINKILKKLNISNNKFIVLIDARNNKPSASKMTSKDKTDEKKIV